MTFAALISANQRNDETVEEFVERFRRLFIQLRPDIILETNERLAGNLFKRNLYSNNLRVFLSEAEEMDFDQIAAYAIKLDEIGGFTKKCRFCERIGHIYVKCERRLRLIAADNKMQINQLSTFDC